MNRTAAAFHPNEQDVCSIQQAILMTLRRIIAVIVVVV